MAEGLGQQVEAERPFFRAEERGVVYTNTVLVADGATEPDEGFAGSFFHLPPLGNLLLRVGQDAE